MFKLEIIKIKTRKHMLNPFGEDKFTGFVINDNGSKLTVLKPTDKSFEYFHLINIEDQVITPISGPISRLELSGEFDFTKPKRQWLRSTKQ